MRIRHFIAFVAIAVAACGGDSQSKSSEGGEAAAAAAPAVDPAQAATIAGVIRFEGSAPANEAIDMSAEPACAGKHSTPPTKSTVVANGNGTLRNVFVYVKQGLPQQQWPEKPGQVILDQQGCEYHPHVVGLQTGQDLTIRNSDGLLHNVNAKPSTNRGFNVGQPTNMDTRRSFPAAEVMIPVTCEVHGWMEAYIGVVDHPFFAVSGEDGSYRLEGLPPGTYTIEAWHEKYGTKQMQVTVAAQETKQTDFSYSASAVAAHVPLGEPIDLHGTHGAGKASAH